MAISDALRRRPHPESLLKPVLFATSGSAILASALAIMPWTPASAQDAQQRAEEEIVVTGSRIRRQDFTANSPIQTVDEEIFDQTTSIGVETVLNQLPQFVPAVTQFTTVDVQQTATNTVGASTVSLRGLGPNRNLVLINGRRAMPVNATMVVDTNSIPSAAIARVEVISGGASAVYGADAVGGVVNFVLKDDFEGATVDIRVGDTQHGGNQEVSISGLIGANMAGDRGNVMLGVERSTRSKQYQWERDWRVDDMRNPSTPATAFGWGTDTWLSNDFAAAATGAGNPSQIFVNQLFNQATPCTVGANEWASPPPLPPGSPPGTPTACDPDGDGVNDGVPNNARFFINRNDGTVYTGLMHAPGAAGSYRYTGPLDDDYHNNFPGLPFRVYQPNGNIKENNFWQWASTPLERLSAFARGVFDLTDTVRLTSQAMVTRTETQTSLGLTADTITVWGALLPFGNDPYEGDPEKGIPNPLNPDGTTNSAYLPGGRFGVDCEAPNSPERPWADGLPGCTQTEAWPVTPEIWHLMRSRENPDADLWVNRPPDYIRDAIGAARSSTNTLTTMQFSMGLEGELPSGNDFWDVTVSTGRTDNFIVQRGSARLSTWRGIMASPNYGRNSVFDPNPQTVGFAESIPTCTSGLPIIEDFPISQDCIRMMTPDLKNKVEVTQTDLEANLVGDLVEMAAGPLQYALGAAYRENSYSYEPDNLSQNQNYIDPIAGLFPNEDSFGEFDVKEIYGELLIPIVSNGPFGVEHFKVELGGRLSDWSMPQVDKVTTYKALIDWAVTPNYRIRGGYNRALRAPNLGELFVSRTQIFGAAAGFGDHCSKNHRSSPWSANPDPATRGPNHLGDAQAAQTEAICRYLMGPAGAFEYYDNRPVDQQPEVGGAGTQNSFGNPNLREEEADTWTLGVVMSPFENWTITLDYYQIEITDMIAIESANSHYQRCLSIELNPTGDPTIPACQTLYRDPTNGNPANIDNSFTNQGRALVEGIDLQLNWSKPIGAGGFNLNTVANYNLASETQDSPELDTVDWKGTQGCSLQIQCQGYEYRIFTTASYFRGPWNIALRHQFWPKIEAASCLTNPAGTGCRYGGVQENYNLFALTGGYQFNDRYRITVGIENLFDKDPPCTGGNPEASPFPVPCTRNGGATYDPLGRRGFVTLSMDF
ncbi:MAG TPA: TonB-dependent receptor [Gammaproteobacteria bacterium]